ncbi:MAG: hypothetical protein E6J90_10105 [Deltaproteobacteria bacterium]|nr:MAG: hypothetical protein E6J91_07605 [Deltaproteobacteria bacterium]TMQ23631.1 MAG: hypothetical protein E6J90_10105 [Deltaproteobacteria bacterium]
MSIPRACLIGCVLASLASVAQADDEDAAASRAPDGQYAVMRGVQGPAGMFAARLLLGFNVSAGKAGDPISFAPDLYYSVTDTLQLGLVHDGPMGWQSRPGLGFCLTGQDHGCPHVYDNVGFDAMYGVSVGAVRLSTHTSLFLSHFSPVTMSLALGVMGKARLGSNVALLLDPKIAIELTERDTIDDALYVPLELQFQVGASTTLKLLTGLSAGLSTFADSYEIPVGIGLLQNLTRHLDIGLRFSFDNLLGHEPMGVGRADSRSLALLFNARS